MPVLPVIDLLIFVGWTSLSIGAVLKAIYVSTSYRPTLFGLAPIDLMMVAGCALLFAVALAARTWVRANEPAMLAARRQMGRLQDLSRSVPNDFNAPNGTPPAEASEPAAPEAIPSMGGR